MRVTPRGKIKLNLEIYKTIIATTVRYANVKIPEEDWAEVYGLLYGYINGDDVIVTEAIPFTHTKKQRHILKVEFDEEDYALAASIETEEFYVRDPPQYIVGWYHSHPGIKLMLSQDDVKNQLAWQSNNPLAVALVFNPVRLQKQIEVPARKGDPVKQLHLDTGFLNFRLDDPNRGLEAAFHIVPFEFTDFKLDESLISNAQEFARYVTRAFPRGDDVVMEYRRYIETTLSKLDEIYNGTSSYLNTLIRKGENDRIPQVVESQMQEAIKILEQGNNLINIYKIMKNYLEYKEREPLIPQIDEIFANWDLKTENYIEKFQKLATIE